MYRKMATEATAMGEAMESNRREAPRAAVHGQTHRARLDGQTSEAETVDSGDERVAVGQGSRPRGRRGRERERECVCMYSNESRATGKSQRSREDKRRDASIRVTGKTN